MNPALTGSGGEEAWAGERVARWLRQSEGLERQLAPVSGLLFAAADIGAGETVLDVGCGTGPTTREAAVLAGATGRVTGLDVSGEMLAAAAQGAPPSGAAAIEWVEADVVTWSAPEGRYDVVISRFGVMFFADPARAMATLARATRPGGRLAFAVWGVRTDSPLFEVPYQAALAVAGGAGLAGVPDSVGPFAWRDAEQVIALLDANGWHDTSVAPHRVRLPLGGGVGADDAALASLDFGATRQLLADADEATRRAAGTAIAEALADHVDADGVVRLDAAVQIVTARR